MAATVKSRHLLILVVVLAAGSACSSDSPGTEAPKVATLSSPDSAPAGSAPASSAAPARPRERLDTTPEEFEAMLGPYRKCMVAHGAMSEKDVGAGGEPRPATKAETAEFDKGNRICEPLHA